MAQKYLLEFLNVGVIDLNGDDSKLEKLRDTAKDLAAVLRKSVQDVPLHDGGC